MQLLSFKHVRTTAEMLLPRLRDQDDRESDLSQLLGAGEEHVARTSSFPRSAAFLRSSRSFEGDLDLDVTAGRGGIHDGGYFADVTLEDAPLGISKHHNGQRSAPQILLYRHVLVRGDQDLEPGFLSGLEQLAVGQPVPTCVFCLGDDVTGKKRNERRGSPVIK